MIKQITVSANGQGLHEITQQLNEFTTATGINNGLCTVFVRHTSASLLIQENADPDARHDLEVWLNKLVPTNDPDYTHVNEGPDDMPSHIKSMLTNTSIAIPVINGKLALGTWQGVFLWEHRHRNTRRNIVIHLQGDA